MVRVADRLPGLAMVGALIDDALGATRLAVGDVRSGARRRADGDRVRWPRVDAQRPRVLALHVAPQETPGPTTVFGAEHAGGALLLGHLLDPSNAADTRRR